MRTVAAAARAATRLVLIRHGEAVCNVSGVCGGPQGCEGLTDLGRRQVEALRDRLLATGELPAPTPSTPACCPGRSRRPSWWRRPWADRVDRVRPGPPPLVVTDCGLCELHPGEADGLTGPSSPHGSI